MTDTPLVEAPSGATLLRATLAAAFVAGALLLTVVLPAEYGLDPLGTGEALGLVLLSGSGQPPEITVRPDGLISESATYRVDRRTFVLDPGKYVEYKYGMEADGTMVYSWTADRPVRSEMHSEPWWAGADAEFFEVEESTSGRHGSYTAPFPGVHGWYWLNETNDVVTLTIHAAGFFGNSLEYMEGVSTPVDRAVSADPWTAAPVQIAP